MLKLVSKIQNSLYNSDTLSFGSNRKPTKLVSLRANTMDFWITYQQDTLAADSTAGANLRERLPIWERKEVVRSEPSVYSKDFADSGFNTKLTTSKPRPVLLAYEKTPVNTDWLAVLLFVTIAIFATIRYSYINYIKHLFTSLLNYPTSVRLWQESNYPASHAAYRLDVIFYLSFSVFVFQTFGVLGIAGSTNSILFYLLIAAGVFLYFYGKRLLYQLVGTLFETRNETGEFLFNMSNFQRTLGIVLIPLIALGSFSPFENPKIIVFAGIVVVIAFQLVLMQRGVIILLRKQFSILYLFLYLCTLEFLPLLLIYKVVVIE